MTEATENKSNLGAGIVIDILCRSAVSFERQLADTRLRHGQVSPADEAQLMLMWNDLTTISRGEA
jgi:hypothetical protein